MQFLILFLLAPAALLLLADRIACHRQIKALTKKLRGLQEHDRFVSVDFISRNLEELTVCINRILDDRERGSIEAAKNYRILQQSIANISHDMRTPLTSVIGYLQLAIRTCSEQQPKASMEIALERAKYCNRLINDFYELSIAEAKERALPLVRIDLSGLLCEQILGNYLEFEAHGIKPVFPDSDKPAFVLADEAMLTRILQNFISNAFKYAAKDVEFDIEKEDGPMTRLTVSNPVAQNNIDTELIFEKFYQRDLARGGDGSGIGLYLCRRFAEQMGGHIRVECRDGILRISVWFLTARSDSYTQAGSRQPPAHTRAPHGLP